jgi:hypothetical protein
MLESSYLSLFGDTRQHDKSFLLFFVWLFLSLSPSSKEKLSANARNELELRDEKEETSGNLKSREIKSSSSPSL